MKTKMMPLVVESGRLSANIEAAPEPRDPGAAAVSVESRKTPYNSIGFGDGPSSLAPQPGKGARLAVLQPAHSQGLKESKKREQP